MAYIGFSLIFEPLNFKCQTSHVSGIKYIITFLNQK